MVTLKANVTGFNSRSLKRHSLILILKRYFWSSRFKYCLAGKRGLDIVANTKVCNRAVSMMGTLPKQTFLRIVFQRMARQVCKTKKGVSKATCCLKLKVSHSRKSLLNRIMLHNYPSSTRKVIRRLLMSYLGNFLRT